MPSVVNEGWVLRLRLLGSGPRRGPVLTTVKIFGERSENNAADGVQG